MFQKGKFVLLSFLLGLIYIIFFYDKDAGMSYPLFIAMLTGSYAYVLKDSGILNKNKGWLFFIPVLLLSFNFFFSTNPILYVFNHLLIFALLIVMTSLSLKKTPVNWGGGNFLIELIVNTAMPVAFFHKPYTILFDKLTFIENKKTREVVVKIIIGLLVAAPILLIVTALLASADAVFSNMISFIPEKLQKLFGNIDVVDLIFKTFWTIVIGTYFFSYMFALLKHNEEKPERRFIDEDLGKNINFDSTIMLTVLTLVNIVYILFCSVQFSYLFGGGNAVLPNNLTFAEYARHGFFELIVVSIINFSIILVTLVLSMKKTGGVKTAIKALLLLISGATFVMLYSSFYRMGLYQQNYGYTYLRVFVYFFLTLEAIALCGTVLYILMRNFNLVKMYVITFLVCYIGLNYINIDASIAKSNVDRYFSTGKVDVPYLTTLSYDSAPEIERLLKSKDPEIKKQVKEYLDSQRGALNRNRYWFEYNYSISKAKDVVNRNK